MSVEQGQKKKRGRPIGTLVPLRCDHDRLAIVFMHAMSNNPALHTSITVLDGNGTFQHGNTIARQAWLWFELRDLAERQSTQIEVVALETPDENSPSKSVEFPYLLFDRRKQKTVTTGNRKKKGDFSKPDTRIKKLTEKYARAQNRQHDRIFIENNSDLLATLIGFCLQKMPIGLKKATRFTITQCGQDLEANGFDIAEMRALLDRIRLQRKRALWALSKPKPE